MRAKIALSLVFLLLFCSPTQFFDVPLDPPLIFLTHKVRDVETTLFGRRRRPIRVFCPGS